MSELSPSVEGSTPPVPLTSFIGRDRDIATVTDLLQRRDVRLLTLTGPGGVGKTRLALRVAEQSGVTCAVSVVFVSLGELKDGNLILPAIGQAMALRTSGDRPLLDQLSTIIAPHRLLLILDNFEHLLTAAPLVTDLLITCQRLTVLATSREPLSLTGEHTIAIGPLRLPQANAPLGVMAHDDAVRLFTTRAQARRADFTLTESNAQDVAAICRRLDGLPLAIELAAARVAHLNPTAILERLERRLPILTGGPRDVPERQQTMAATIVWSHDLLTEHEQVLFRRLAVFDGGFTLEAAEAVMPDTSDSVVLEGTASLVAKSLIQPEDGVGGEPRYRMLETIREFALEQLLQAGEDEQIRAALTTHFLGVAERLRPGIESADGVNVLERLESEHANLRVALTWAVERNKPDTALRLTGALWKFWWVHCHVASGRQWLERALALHGSVPLQVRLEALYGAGSFALAGADYQRALIHGTSGLALADEAGEPLHSARFRYLLGNAALDLGNWDEAAQHFAAAIAGYRTCDTGGATRDVDFAQHGAAMALLGAATIALLQGDQDRATAYSAEALEIWRARGDRWGLAQALAQLAAAAGANGEVDRASTLYRESLGHYAASGDDASVAESVASLGRLAARHGQGIRAARLLGAAEGLRATIGAAPSSIFRADDERAVAIARGMVSESVFAAAWAAGRRLDREEAITEALTDSHPSAPGDSAMAQSVGVNGLTRRESEVLRLLVDGKTDRQIGEALFLSRRTVTSHVSAILGKLGVETRTAAASVALRRGLV